MPQPNRNEYIDTTLQDVAQAYFQSQMSFIAARAFPTVGVSKQSAKYPIFLKEAFLRNDMARRPNGEESAGSGFVMSSDSYMCDVFALHKDITNQDRANWTLSNISIEDAATEYLTQQALQQLEQQWVTDVFTTSVWGTDATPGTLWSAANSDPIGDVLTGKRTVLVNTGFEPNVLIVGYDVWIQLVQHADIVARVVGGGTSAAPSLVSRAAVAAILDVEELLVAKAVKATNVEGETAAYGFTHGKHGLLIHRPATPSLAAPSAGYTFMWEGVGNGSSQISIANIPAPLRKADRLEIEMGFDYKVTGSDLGYFFNGAVA